MVDGACVELVNQRNEKKKIKKKGSEETIQNEKLKKGLHRQTSLC